MDGRHTRIPDHPSPSWPALYTLLPRKSKRICGANLSVASFLAHSAVLETADLAGVPVGGAEPSFKARLVYEPHRTAAVAWRQKHLADAHVMTDPAYWAAGRATNITTGNYSDGSRHSLCQHRLLSSGFTTWLPLIAARDHVRLLGVTFVRLTSASTYTSPSSLRQLRRSLDTESAATLVHAHS